MLTDGANTALIDSIICDGDFATGSTASWDQLEFAIAEELLDCVTRIMHTHKICKIVAAPSGRELHVLSSKQRGRSSAYSSSSSMEAASAATDPSASVRCWPDHCSCASFLALARTTTETVFCEHMLAVRLSQKMNKVEIANVPDADFWRYACPECMMMVADCI